MPQPHTLRITEIFPSLQGEGLRQGEPTIFIRLSGCNLRCAFCDTKYAWTEGKGMSADQILKEVKSAWKEFPADWVCLTGGEPLQQNIVKLLERLKQQKFKIQVETNATFPPSFPVDWYTISPKPKEYYFSSEYINTAKEVKLVITKELTSRIIRKMRHKFHPEIPILLQPESGKVESMKSGMKLINDTMHMGLKNIKISVQLHKILRIA